MQESNCIKEADNNCCFSTGIDDSLTCCKDGLFDFNGFPINKCPEYPCNKYENVVTRLKEIEKERSK
jgi:hypothetical protein